MDSAEKSLVLLASDNAYYKKIRRLFGSSIVAYWPLYESSGTVANDVGVNDLNATYIGLTLANKLGVTGKPVPLFPGTGTADINAYSAGLASAFSGAEGSFIFWGQFATGALTDAAIRKLIYFRVDGSNYIYIDKHSADYSLRYYYVAGGTAEGLGSIFKSYEPFCIAISWSKSNDRFRVYVNGCLQVSSTGLGTFAGSLSNLYTRIGSFTGSAEQHSGWMNDVVLLNKEITDAEVRSFIKNAPRATIYKLTTLGDSITASATTNWGYLVSQEWQSGNVGYANRAVSGQGIISNMDAQVVAAANDDANVIIIELGTIDDNAGNMTTLQAEAEENIAELKASNPNATIYWMNVLPRWADATTGAEVDKSNIRTAIATACTAQGITCWDTYSTPWIAQDETADGLHPTAAGHAAIAAAVLALLP